jgi:hypothetical protein
VRDSTTTTDAWVTLSYQFTYGSGLDGGDVRVTQIVTGNNPNYVFTGANSASDDLIYIRNVTITELDTYRTQDVTYHNPAVRLRRDSDDIHKSFPAGAFTQMQNWANEDVAVCNDNLNNGGFENRTGDNFDNWSESTSGTSSVNAETVDVDAGSASCRIDIDGSNSFAGISLNSLFALGQEFTYSVRLKATGGNWQVGSAGGAGVDTVTPTTSWATYTGTLSATNTAFTIKRSSSANQSLYIDQVEVTITQANAYATTWYDQSGEDNDATQTTAASQPKVVDAGALTTDANGNYRPLFDGTDDTMQSGAFTLSAQPKTIVVIGDFTASSNPQYFVDGSASNRGAIGEAASAARWRIFAGTVSDYTVSEVAVNTTYVASAVFNGALSELFVDGTGKGAKNVGTGGLDQITIGSRADQAQAFLNGGVCAIIAYPESANRSAIEQSLSNTLTTALS